MAKRAPIDQKPFNALDKGLAASVMNSVAVLPAEQESHPASGNTALTAQPAKAPVRVELPAPQTSTTERPVSEAQATTPPKQVLRAVNPVTARQPVVTPKAAGEHPHQEKLAREKRVLLTLSEEREIERCVDRIAEGFGGTPVKLSHIIRACLTVMRHSENEIIQRAQEVGQLTRPPNGDNMALAEFEHELAKVLSQAFRDAPSLR